MQGRALRKGGHLLVFGVILKLLDTFCALRFKFSLLSAIRDVLELDDVTVRYVAVVIALREQEETDANLLSVRLEPKLAANGSS